MTNEDEGGSQELTETERNRYRAAKSASADLREAFVSGDEEERHAAAGQFLQAISKIDPEATLDKIHVPHDAGQYRDALVRMMLRIPDGWGRWISCSAGWYPLIAKLDDQLAELDPEYELYQCKEKFGGLRYYARTERKAIRTTFDALIDDAESRSALICELCGQSSALCVSAFSWLRTLCTTCASTNGYGRIGEVVDRLTPELTGVWLVIAQDSKDLWDLNRRQYSRMPLSTDTSDVMPGDGKPGRLAQVIQWPQTGGHSHVVIETGGSDSEWHVSTNISRIERIR